MIQSTDSWIVPSWIWHTPKRSKPPWLDPALKFLFLIISTTSFLKFLKNSKIFNLKDLKVLMIHFSLLSNLIIVIDQNKCLFLASFIKINVQFRGKYFDHFLGLASNLKWNFSLLSVCLSFLSFYCAFFSPNNVF